MPMENADIRLEVSSPLFQRSRLLQRFSCVRVIVRSEDMTYEAMIARNRIKYLKRVTRADQGHIGTVRKFERGEGRRPACRNAETEMKGMAFISHGYRIVSRAFINCIYTIMHWTVERIIIIAHPISPPILCIPPTQTPYTHLTSPTLDLNLKTASPSPLSLSSPTTSPSQPRSPDSSYPDPATASPIAAHGPSPLTRLRYYLPCYPALCYSVLGSRHR